MTSAALQSIGDVAGKLNVSLRTIRFYEDFGLLQTQRGVGNKRYLDDDAVLRMKQILYLQRFGLTLREISENLRSLKPNETPMLDRSQILDQMKHLKNRHSVIISQIGELEEMLRKI